MMANLKLITIVLLSLATGAFGMLREKDAPTTVELTTTTTTLTSYVLSCIFGSAMMFTHVSIYQDYWTHPTGISFSAPVQSLSDLTSSAFLTPNTFSSWLVTAVTKCCLFGGVFFLASSHMEIECNNCSAYQRGAKYSNRCLKFIKFTCSGRKFKHKDHAEEYYEKTRSWCSVVPVVVVPAALIATFIFDAVYRLQ